MAIAGVTYALKQNVLIAPDTIIHTARTSAMTAGYPAENVMGWIPSRPAKFGSFAAATKSIGFQLSSSILCNMIAIIELRSNLQVALVPNSYAVERAMQYRLMRGSAGTTEVFTWTSQGPISDWGYGCFRRFTPVADQFWSVEVRVSGTNVTDASIGCILLGSSITLDTNPALPYPRETRGSTTYSAGRPGTPVINPRHAGARGYRMQIYHTDETARVAFSALLAGFGHRVLDRTDLIRPRLDIPTAFVPPEMHVDETSDLGACVFGMFDQNPRYLTGVGGQAITEIVFEEIV